MFISLGAKVEWPLYLNVAAGLCLCCAIVRELLLAGKWLEVKWLVVDSQLSELGFVGFMDFQDFVKRKSLNP